MSWRLDYTRQARKDIRAIRDKSLLRRLNAALLALQDDPRPPGAVKLAGHRDHWRVRVGDWRVVYRVEDGAVLVLVVAVAPRGEVYGRV